MKNNKVIGVGIIGASEGSWAVNSHLPALKLLPQKFKVVAISTSHLESAQATAQNFGIPHAFDNEKELVDHPEVDLVVIAVKVPTHFKLVSAAIAAGKMVFCEWPLGNGLKEATDLLDLANKFNVKTFCGLQAQVLPEMRFLKDWLAGGNLGDIFSTTVIGGGNHWGTVLPTASQAYLVDPDNGATMLHIPFAHFLSGLQFTLGEIAESSLFLARRNDWVQIADSGKKIPQLTNDQILFSGTISNGVIFSVNFHGGEYNGSNLQWEIYGSKGKLVIESPSGHLQFGKLKMKISMLDGQSKDLVVPDDYHPAAGGTPGLDAPLSRGVYYAYEQIFDDISNDNAEFPDFAFAVRHHELLSVIMALQPQQ